MKIHTSLGILVLSVLFVFNISKPDADGNWTQKTDMPTPRFSFAASVVDGKIYAIGGEIDKDVGEVSIATVEMYDPLTDTWTQKTDMPTPRAGLSTSAVDGKIYAIGGVKVQKIQKPVGWSYKLTDLPTVEMYDPLTDTWTQKTDMPTPRAGLSTSAVDGKIYAIGGEAFALLREKKQWRLKTAEVYNPATDTWGKSRPLNHARDGLTTSVVDGEIYAIGGTGWPQIPNHPGPFLASVEVLNPRNPRNWRKKTEMPVAPRAGHTASVIDGKIYVVGGVFRDNGPLMYLPTIEIYDPQLDAWTQAPDMPVGSSFHTAAVLKGKLYILGGLRAGHKGPLSRVEVYEPGGVSQRVTPRGKLLNKTWGFTKKGK